MSSSATRLGPDDHKRILLDRVIPKSGIPDTSAQEMPRAVILAGQPGAGKGGLTRLARAEFEQNSVDSSLKVFAKRSTKRFLAISTRSTQRQAYRSDCTTARAASCTTTAPTRGCRAQHWIQSANIV